MRKILAIMVCLLFFASLCQAQFYILEQHEIQIGVDSVGSTQISEKYFMRFQNEQQLIDFRQTVEQIGVSVDGWQNYDSRIFPHIGQERDIVVSGISFNENDVSPDFLEMSYSLKESIMEKKLETSRIVDYGLKAKFFNEFREGPLWVIPEGTSIKVSLPKGVEIKDFVRPDALVSENVVLWEGYVSGNELFLEYSFFRQISSFDFNLMLQELMKSDLFLMFLGVAAVIFLILFAKRKSLSGKVEGYVIEHSDLTGEEED